VITAWRLIQGSFVKDVFSGEGARLYGGRWNHAGVGMVYLSEYLSLAALEQIVHLEHVPKVHYFSIKAKIPDNLLIETVSNLPPDWQSDPPPESTKVIGDEWVLSGRTAILRVPSVVVPSEYNYLLNPTHADFKKIQRERPEPFYFDHRVWHRGGRR
jgi:RES domain-containing protein